MRQARTESALTLTSFAKQCELSASYMTEIERGRKYPRADKILKMAEVLGKSYDDLVSIKLPSSLRYLETTLSSSAFQRFPYEEFGFEAADLITLLTREPDKASALLHGMLDISRRYGLKEKDFLWAALRSYQEIYENYFQALEDEALSFTEEFGVKYGLSKTPPINSQALDAILQDTYKYVIDTTTIAANPILSKFRSVFMQGRHPNLLINSTLWPRQVKFTLARELGYQYLKIKDRSTTSTPDQINSFGQIHNDFKAAYFGGALLMPRAAMLDDIEHLFNQETFQPQLLLTLLDKYDVTPEMLFYRFSELIPQFFGIKLHFLRFHHQPNTDRFHLVKELNMNQLIVPSGIGAHEHYCRRWLSVRLLNEMPQNGAAARLFDRPYVGVQISEFVESQDRFLCLGFSRPLVLTSNVNSSVIVGFRITGDMKHIIRFANDVDIPRVIINETCERCPLTADQCDARANEPTTLQEEQSMMARKLALSQLQERRRG